ncbi:A/G-specific adenine glycosylase [Desulforhopalus singaporensis]|uniref:Adenine DNA glycosylase n=1 Tax=Desulforhopalus singaporensis TaxID=91360 RepID=A0A1H0U950_9BACT|nr:A/G-specific adenine glycosylase [Desulforhopalus singaporensis]SDP62797.1 A/G-specific DNA-adenine glycosylase [Desulforhopalus singaporensis]
MNREAIVTELLSWFFRVKRDLPWRSTYDPYHVWVSEIMLQQTQMERGIRYFLEWIERFPDLVSVAQAPEQEILKMWEGLGYYSRARNLHRAAKIMIREHGGVVPCSSAALIGLPGIGPYTAAAIASIAGNEDIAAVDANVCRVFSRLFDIAEPIKTSKARNRISSLAEELLPRGRARQFNQALMDLGGLVCTPKIPRCSDCPLHKECRACNNGLVQLRPVKSPGVQAKEIHRVVGLIHHDERIFIQQRGVGGVWPHLWEFPGTDLQGRRQKVDEEKVRKLLRRSIFDETGLAVTVHDPVASVRHQYTSNRVVLDCYFCSLTRQDHVPVLRSAVNSSWVAPDQLEHYSFPAGPRKILEQLENRWTEIITAA